MTARSALKRLLPQPILDLRLSWIRWQQRRGERRAFHMTGGKIVAGPFRGLKFVADAGGIPLAPKLFGTYEKEIQPFLQDAIADGVDVVVNIGAGEGYYVACMLMHLPDARAVAFETDPARQRLIGELMQLNGMADRVEILGECDAAALRAALETAHHPLVLCDIEGGENEVIDPELVPVLRDADMIVEVHDFIVPGTGDRLRERFADTHEIDSVTSRPRTVDDAPESPRWRSQQVVEMLWERRPCEMEWLRLRAWSRRSGSPTSGRSSG
ncbi:MAG: hypothetical protein PVJ49_00305 [Acidobacteriota bacterium]